jgi:hypothetical protein
MHSRYHTDLNRTRSTCRSPVSPAPKSRSFRGTSTLDGTGPTASLEILVPCGSARGGTSEHGIGIGVY